MPTYIVESGNLKKKIETKYPTSADALAIMALTTKPLPKKLGSLLSVKGGEYSGEDEMYYSTEWLLRDLGLMAKE